MELILVRHGETDWNRQERCQGISNIPLNSNGRKQAEVLAESLKNQQLSAIYSSDLSRAMDTAREIAKHHSLSVRIESDFKEMNQGDFEGLDFKYIRAHYGHILKKWREEPENLRLPGGESLIEVQNRAWEAFTNIYKEHEDKRVLVVSHNLTIITLLCKFSGKSLSSFREFIVGETSKSVIHCDNDSYRIIVVNDLAHLN